MGILNRNINKDDIIYNRIIKNIKDVDNVDQDIKNKLINYINQVKNNKIKNDFYELDFLERAINSFFKNYYDMALEIEDFDKLIKIVKFLLPAGMDSNNYYDIKELILDNFNIIDDVLIKDIESYGLCSYITKKIDYANIMNIIIKYDNLKNNYDRIIKLASSIAPYVDEETLRNYVVVFISNIYKIDDLDNYINEKIEECKLRVGIPMIDEKSIAIISSEVKRAQGLLRKIEIMEKNVQRYKVEVETLTNAGEKRLVSIVDEKVKAIVTELDEYLVKLEESMRLNANQAFNQVMESAAEKIKEIRMSALEITNVTTSEILRLRSESDEIVRNVQSFVKDDPKVQEIVEAASKDALVRDAIISMKRSGNGDTGAKKVEVVSDSSERKITSGPTVIISDTDIIKEILPLYNQDIPFSERYAIYLAEKMKRISGGKHSRKELFHEKSDEAAKCIMENDWLYGYGPSGSGKSKTIYQLADIFNTDIIPNGKVTDKYSLMAYNDPHGKFRPTPAYLAVKEGKILLLDEFDNGNPDTQVLLNELYSAALDVAENPQKPRYVYFGENIMVRVHPNFRLVSLGNTDGAGENELYSSRSKIDESVLERMTPKFFDYDPRLEEEIFGKYTNWREFARKFRKACMEWAKKEGLSDAQGTITTRDASAISKYAKNNSKTLVEILSEKFIQTKDAQYLGYIMQKVANYYEINEVRNFEYPTDIGKIKEVDIAKAFVLEIKKRNNL